MSRLESLKIKAKLLQKAKAKSGKPIQLKEAFQTIASAAGFSSWQDMKATLDANEVLCPAGHSAIWKTWYSSYEEARKHLALHGGFLLPYQKDFFICDDDYLKFLGIEESDADLAAVGRNWAEPQDMQAFTRLLKTISRKA